MILPSRDLRDFAPSRSLAGSGRQRLRAGRVERRTEWVLEAAAAEAATPRVRGDVAPAGFARAKASSLPPTASRICRATGCVARLARCCGARNILEIGTLAAYSTIWLARALPAEGKLITLEADAKHAEIARANLKRAGLEEKVELVLGWALETLPRLAAEKRGPFDLIFIDADKPSTADYFDWAVK